jgi:hypothetical protein
MSRYLVSLQDGADSGDGCGREVQLTLNDPLWGNNTWSIATPNSWIGNGMGAYISPIARCFRLRQTRYDVPG